MKMFSLAKHVSFKQPAVQVLGVAAAAMRNPRVDQSSIGAIHILQTLARRLSEAPAEVFYSVASFVQEEVRTS